MDFGVWMPRHRVLENSVKKKITRIFLPFPVFCQWWAALGCAANHFHKSRPFRPALKKNQIYLFDGGTPSDHFFLS